MEAVKHTFLPKTSAIWPQQGIKAAAVRLKADTIQFNCETSPKSPAIHGKALAMLNNCLVTWTLFQVIIESYIVASRAWRVNGKTRPRIMVQRYFVAAFFSALHSKHGDADDEFDAAVTWWHVGELGVDVAVNVSVVSGASVFALGAWSENFDRRYLYRIVAMFSRDTEVYGNIKEGTRAQNMMLFMNMEQSKPRKEFMIRAPRLNLSQHVIQRRGNHINERSINSPLDVNSGESKLQKREASWRISNGFPDCSRATFSSCLVVGNCPMI